jgi:hypothetical protein
MTETKPERLGLRGRLAHFESGLRLLGGANATGAIAAGALMKERLLETQFPGESEELADLDQAIAVTERAINVNTDEMVKEIGITKDRFSELADPVMREVDAANAAEFWQRSRAQMSRRSIRMSWSHKSKTCLMPSDPS